MARPGPKSSKKGKPAPKSKKVEEVEEVEVEVEDDRVDNNGSTDEVHDSDVDDEPPAKKGRGAKGKAAAKKTPAKKGKGRPARKTPASASAKKKEESEEEEEDDTEYEVQTILEERTRKGTKEYLVRWKGYTLKQATWEPESNLNCDEMIAEFKAKKEEDKKNPGKELREGRKQTERYVDIAGSGDRHRKRHSKRNAQSPRKSYRDPDSD